MRRYQFVQRCRPTGDLRTRDVQAFLVLMKEAFGIEGWFHEPHELIGLELEEIEQRLRATRSKKDLERFGANWVLGAKTSDDQYLVLTIMVGGDQWAPNDFSVDFTRTQILPDLSYFRRSIEIVRPFEAFISDSASELAIDAKFGIRRMENEYDLLILRWFQYLNADMIAAAGGLERCLGIPAFKVEPFCEGVLIQLTAEPFDGHNQRHLAVQEKAMQYLGLV